MPSALTNSLGGPCPQHWSAAWTGLALSLVTGTAVTWTTFAHGSAACSPCHAVRHSIRYQRVNSVPRDRTAGVLIALMFAHKRWCRSVPHYVACTYAAVQHRVWKCDAPVQHSAGQVPLLCQPSSDAGRAPLASSLAERHSWWAQAP